ncbi:MAG: TonB-dependent receptor, partial [Myxococcota bacterium]
MTRPGSLRRGRAVGLATLTVLAVLAPGATVAQPDRAGPTSNGESAGQAGGDGEGVGESDGAGVGESDGESDGESVGAGDGESSDGLDGRSDGAGLPEYTTVVEASRTGAEGDQLPVAISVVNSEAWLGQPRLSLAEALVAVPGVDARNRSNFAQDLRLSIRGFGARAAFGVRGVHIVVDGIPLTLPDGQSQLDALGLDLVERIEIIRGPAAALYGNGAGGVVRLRTRRPGARPELSASLLGGSAGLLKARVSATGHLGPVAVVAGAVHRQAEGHRQQSRFREHGAALLATGQLGPATEVRVIGHVLYAPVADDPGGLTAEALAADPDQAAETNLRFRTGESVSHGQVGATLSSVMGTYHEVTAGAHLAARRFAASVPFRYVEFDRLVVGVRAGDTYRRPWGLRASSLALGIDAQLQLDDRQNFGNDDGMADGSASLDQREQVAALGIYAQEQLQLARRWSVLIGGRVDWLRFAVADRLVADTADSGSTARTFFAASGMAGAVFTPADPVTLYANIAQVFETPTTTELVGQPGEPGGLNRDLAPQRGLSAELGVRARPDRRVEVQAGLLWIGLTDELVRFEDDTGRALYRNAGRSRRLGAELAVSIRPGRGLSARVGVTALDSRFRSYTVDGVDLSGNAVPGVAPFKLGATMAWRPSSRWFAAVDGQYVAAIPADDGNTVHSAAYTRFDLRAGYRWAWRRYAA